MLLLNGCLLIICLQFVNSFSNNNLSSFNASTSVSEPIINSNSKGSTLDVLFIIPNHIDNNIFNLNEKNTFINDYKNGWLLPSEEEMTIDLYLYYEGFDQQHLNVLDYQNDGYRQYNTNKTHSFSTKKVTLFMFFTTERHCIDFIKRDSWVVEIKEKLGANMYRAQLNGVTLAYSSQPYYICMQQFGFDDNIHDSFRIYSFQGTDFWITILTTRNILATWIRIVLFILLLGLAGWFSGLNLGLMSLSLNELELLEKIGTLEEKKLAKKIYPLRKKGNFLLCTMLLGNVLVNAVSTLILGNLISGIYAACGSTLLIVIFGEIIPQAICTKYGLVIGAYTRHLTYFFMVFISPISFPISIVLDKILGKETSIVYSSDEIKQLMSNVDDLSENELKMILSALNFHKKKARDVMTSLDDVFMLDKNTALTFETRVKIMEEGYSRIPIYEENRENIVGLLHVKNLPFLFSEMKNSNELPKIYDKNVCFCDAEESLIHIFDQFLKGITHLVFLTEIHHYQTKDKRDLHVDITVVGIVTLEDILEELTQKEIYDEYDRKRNSSVLDKYNNILIDRRASLLNAPSNSMFSKRSFGSIATTTNTTKDFDFLFKKDDIKEENYLISSSIKFRMFQYLFTTVKPFTSEFLTRNVLDELIFKRTKLRESNRLNQSSEYLYISGKPCNYFILILLGEAVVEIGKEKLEIQAKPFFYFGIEALLCGCKNAEDVLLEGDRRRSSIGYNSLTKNEGNDANIKLAVAQNSNKKMFIPDFSLRVDNRCVYIKINRNLWRMACIKSRFQKQGNNKTEGVEPLPNEMILNEEMELSQNDYINQDLKSTLTNNRSLAVGGRRSTIASVTAFNRIQEVVEAKIKSKAKQIELEALIYKKPSLNNLENRSNNRSFSLSYIKYNLNDKSSNLNKLINQKNELKSLAAKDFRSIEEQNEEK